MRCSGVSVGVIAKNAGTVASGSTITNSELDARRMYFGNGNSYGVFVSVPIFAGYYYEGEIRRSEVDYSAAMEGLDRVRAQARTEIARAFSESPLTK